MSKVQFFLLGVVFLFQSCGNERAKQIYSKQTLGSIEVNCASGFYSEVPLLKFQSSKEGELFYTINGNAIQIGSAYTFSCKDSINLAAVQCDQLFKNRTSVDRKGTNDSWEEIEQLPARGYSFRVSRVVNGTVKETAVFNYVLSDIEKEDRSVETVMLTTPSAGIMSSQTGIFAIGDTVQGYHLGNENFYQSGKGWERECEFQYFNKSGELQYCHTVGMSVFGNVSRYFPQKSMRITARKKLGEKRFRFNFFNDERIEPKRMILRTAHCGWKNGIYKDCLIGEVVRDLDLEVAKQKPVAVFINGEYWGIYFLGEKIDRPFIQARYKLKKKQISIVRDNGKADHGDSKLFKEIHNFGFKNDLRQEENYKYFCEQVDISSYIDWLITEIYFQNVDWPCNNTKMWKGKASSKWRSVLMDLDASIIEPEFNTIDRLFTFEKKDNPKFDNRCSFLFNNLMRNESFRKLFADRYRYLLKNVFSEEKLRPLLNKYSEMMQKEVMISWQNERWNHPDLGDFENFEDHFSNWIKVRPAFALGNLEAFLVKMKEAQTSDFTPCSFQFKTP